MCLRCKESQSLTGTLCRCVSLLFDWGAESHVWKSPATFVRDALPFETLFGLALPIPDADHALHHVACVTSSVWGCSSSIVSCHVTWWGHNTVLLLYHIVCSCQLCSLPTVNRNPGDGKFGIFLLLGRVLSTTIALAGPFFQQ